MKFVIQLEDKIREAIQLNEISETSKWDDRMLNRFLRSRNFDVNKTFDMVKQYFKWRDTIGVENIKLDDVKVELLKEGIYLMGQTKTGNPTFVVSSSCNWAHSNMDAIERLFIFVLEYETKKLPKNIESFALILDLKGFSIKNSDRELEKRIFTLFQNYYPERLHKAYIVNAPSFFTVAWKILKNLLSPETVEKFKFLSKPDELQNYFESYQLSSKYGGTSRRTFQDWYLEIGNPETLTINKNPYVILFDRKSMKAIGAAQEVR